MLVRLVFDAVILILEIVLFGKLLLCPQNTRCPSIVPFTIAPAL